MIRDQDTTDEHPALPIAPLSNSGIKRRHTDPILKDGSMADAPQKDFRVLVKDALVDFGLPTTIANIQNDLGAVKNSQEGILNTAGNLVQELNTILNRVQTVSDAQDRRIEQYHEVTERQERAIQQLYEQQVQTTRNIQHDQTVIDGACEQLHRGVQRNSARIHQLGERNSNPKANESPNWWAEADQMQYREERTRTQQGQRSRNNPNGNPEERTHNPYGQQTRGEEPSSSSTGTGAPRFGGNNNVEFGGPLNAPAVSSSKVVPPPMFDGSKFLSWKKDYLFWRDLRWYLSDAQLLSVTGLNANATLRRFLIPFFRNARDQPADRTIEKFLELLQMQYAAGAREREVTYLGDLLPLRRENSDTIQLFWAKYQELVHNLDGSSVLISDSMMFIRLLKNLNLPSAMRLSIISRLDCCSQAHTVENSKKVSVELLGAYNDMLP